MSLEALTIALHHSRSHGAVRLVLIGIANHDGDGGSWPAVATLARYANTTPRNVQRAVVELEKLGEVRRIVNGGGTLWTAHHERPNLYEFVLRCPPACDGTKRHNVVDESYPQGRRPRQGVTPTSGGGATPTSPEPSFNPPTSKTKNVSPSSNRARLCGATRIDPQSGYCLNCGEREDTHS